jgi:hypothetical protein
MKDIKDDENPDWLKKCLECQHCYTLKSNELEYHCRKRNGKCEFKPYKGRKKKPE